MKSLKKGHKKAYQLIRKKDGNWQWKPLIKFLQLQDLLTKRGGFKGILT